MKRFSEQTKAITKAYTTLRDCENMDDLKKLHLTLSDYEAAKDIFNELSTPGSSAKTFITSVADFYKSCGFNVKLTGVNYTIDTITN